MEQTTKLTVHFWDFDATLMMCPHPEEGRVQYEKATGNKYPHRGWWGREESLDMNIFDIKPYPVSDIHIKRAMADPNAKVVLLTNRIWKLKPNVKPILDKYGYEFDIQSFKYNGDDKGVRLRNILDKEFPNATEAIFYDDDSRNLYDVKVAMEGHRVPVKLIKAEDGIFITLQ